MADDDVVLEVAIGPCWACGEVFMFDPDSVPSVLIDPETDLPPDVGGTPFDRGIRQPLCPTCVAKIRQRRLQLGLPAEWSRAGWVSDNGEAT